MHRAFEVHKLNSRGMLKAERLAQTFDTHLAIVREICGEDERLDSLFDKVIDHLELASFYAKKAIARNLVNQDRGGDVGGDLGKVGRPYAEMAGTDQQEAQAPTGAPLSLFSIGALTEELRRRGAKMPGPPGRDKY